MQNPTLGNFGLLMRLWSVVLLGNLIGTGIAARAFEYMPIFDEPTRDAFVKIGMDVMKNTPVEMFSNAIISGWIIATMVWMFPSAGSAKIVVIILMTGLSHSPIPRTLLSEPLKSFIWYLTAHSTGATFSGRSPCQPSQATFVAGPLSLRC